MKRLLRGDFGGVHKRAVTIATRDQHATILEYGGTEICPRLEHVGCGVERAGGGIKTFCADRDAPRNPTTQQHHGTIFKLYGGVTETRLNQPANHREASRLRIEDFGGLRGWPAVTRALRAASRDQHVTVHQQGGAVCGAWRGHGLD